MSYLVCTTAKFQNSVYQFSKLVWQHIGFEKQYILVFKTGRGLGPIYFMYYSLLIIASCLQSLWPVTCQGLENILGHLLDIQQIPQFLCAYSPSLSKVNQLQFSVDLHKNQHSNLSRAYEGLCSLITISFHDPRPYKQVCLK